MSVSTVTMTNESTSNYEAGLFDDLQGSRIPTKDLEIKRILACLPLNPFAVLQVSYHPTADDIESQHKKKADLVHPDKTSLPMASEAYDLLNKSKTDLTNSTIRSRLDQLYVMACKQKLGEAHEGPVLNLDDFISVQTRFETILQDEESQRTEEFMADIPKQKKRFKNSEWRASHPETQYKPGVYKYSKNKFKKNGMPPYKQRKMTQNAYFDRQSGSNDQVDY